MESNECLAIVVQGMFQHLAISLIVERISFGNSFSDTDLLIVRPEFIDKYVIVSGKLI